MRSRFFRLLRMAACVPLPFSDSGRQTPSIAPAILSAARRTYKDNSHSRRTIIVGAGFAGAACAHELSAAGSDLCVFEAQQRVGGRVHTSSDWLEGQFVDLGAELIGSNHYYWNDYARKFKLSLVPLHDNKDPVPIQLDGRSLIGNDARHVYEAMDEIHAQLAIASENIAWDEPWSSPRAAELDRIPFSDFIAALNAPAVGKRGIYVEFAHDLAAAPEKMSTLGVLAIIAAHGNQGYWDETEVFRCAEGAQRLAEMLLTSVDAGRVIMGKPAAKIAHSGNNVTLHLANGEVHEADDLVLAVPPSVWNRIQFSPKLPESLRPQMGTVVKYCAKVRTRCWASSAIGINHLGDDLLGKTWQSVASEDKESAVVVSFSGGPFAEAARAAPANDCLEKYRRAFEAIATGFRLQLMRDEFVDFTANKWIGCGYSCPAPGQVTTVWPALQAGVGRIHFAGEHTALGLSGFMEGALGSGVRVAKLLTTS